MVYIKIGGRFKAYEQKEKEQEKRQKEQEEIKHKPYTLSKDAEAFIRASGLKADSKGNVKHEDKAIDYMVKKGMVISGERMKEIEKLNPKEGGFNNAV